MAGNALKIIVGLGNPGAEYARTRHNAGFWLVDELARRHGGTFRSEGKHQAELARVRIGGEEVWLVKPMTFMNRSGGPVSSVLGFYKLTPAQMLVAHDEIDLPSGTVRLKEAGGHGGHNGLRDIIAAQGDGFWRLRIGVGHPGTKNEVVDFVLTRAGADEQRAIDETIVAGADSIEEMQRVWRADRHEQTARARQGRGECETGVDGMGIKCGIVGLPNVGKSTLFNALTRAQIAAENYPFCTIDPNVGIVPVPDPRLDALSKIVEPEKVVPTTVEFVDIAGLVAGASQGEGLGNKFLAHIRETDAIAHVVRCFEDADIVHVSGRVNPLSDIDIIDTELALTDLQSVEKAVDRNTKAAKGGDKDAARKKELFERMQKHLDDGKPVRSMGLTKEEKADSQELHLLTAKPVMYVANVKEDGFTNNAHLDAVTARAKAEGAQVVAVCAAIEAEISQLEEADRADFLKDLGLAEPGLNRVIRAGYDLLGLQTYFTAGVKEVRAWTVRGGSTAPQAAGVIHTDFERGFIRAEVIGYDDFIKYKGEAGAKDAGKLRLEGKEYLVKEGDVMHFRFNV